MSNNEIFVFGSNLAGKHGAGSALEARLNHGAYYGQGVGLQGRSYAIPTKDAKLKTLSLQEIGHYVNKFVEDAAYFKDKKFVVVEIGCGLAGYSPKDIAPLFKEANQLSNVILPDSFKEILNAELD